MASERKILPTCSACGVEKLHISSYTYAYDTCLNSDCERYRLDDAAVRQDLLSAAPMWRVTETPHTGGRLQLWQRDDEGWIDVGWNTTPDGLRDLIAAASAALGDGALVVSRADLVRLAREVAEAAAYYGDEGMPFRHFVDVCSRKALKAFDGRIAALTAPEVER